MEKIKVNMSPNPLDVQTIHASQNDGEARQWEFELHNNGELIDTSDVTEQMVFKPYEGGTEQLLPENTSTPTTSPFKGDIKYPQGLLTDQEFTYRQSPTEEDGLAKIKSIKGNTLVWNQLVDTNTTSVTLTSGHKFITKVGGTYSLVNGTWQSISVTGGTDEVFDLSLMFGTGNEPATLGEFSSLFPLSYYSYNQGSLLSFNGNGIKTAGFNQYDEQTQAGYWDAQTGRYIKYQGQLCSLNPIRVFPNTEYCFCKPQRYGDVIFFDKNNNFISSIVNLARNYVFTTPSNCYYIQINLGSTYGDTYNNDVCINISDTERNGEYEPYTSHTANLPIATYFPTGMKSAGTVYDELTESKAITRVGSRAYQSGDESDTSVITDGTTTYYALATPTETSFTTASLVTENVEIPLSNEDGVLIGKCTEELSAEPGFIDAKIKLSDSDGECYSNKIQLHVERSPQ